MSTPERRRFSSVFFDLGNTLIYFEGDWDKTFRQGERALLEHLRLDGISLGEGFLGDLRGRLQIYYAEREQEYIEMTSKQVLLRTLTDWGYYSLPENSINHALQAMYAVTQEHWLPEADAIPTLSRLRDEGYRMALISNAADEANTQLLVDKLGGRQFFEMVTISAAAGIRKPNPAIFRSVLEAMQIDPQEAVMVGDTLNADVLGAKNAGIFSIWITRRVRLESELPLSNQIVPDAVIGSLSELPDLLASL